MNDQFALWLNTELDKRGWSQSFAARRGGLAASSVQQVLAGTTKSPGLTFYRGIARAFNMSIEDVLRVAGVIAATAHTHAHVRERRVVYEVNGDALVLDLWRALGIEDQGIVRDLMERLASTPPKIIGVEEGAETG